MLELLVEERREGGRSTFVFLEEEKGQATNVPQPILNRKPPFFVSDCISFFLGAT